MLLTIITILAVTTLVWVFVFDPCRPRFPQKSGQIRYILTSFILVPVIIIMAPFVLGIVGLEILLYSFLNLYDGICLQLRAISIKFQRRFPSVQIPKFIKERW